MCAPRAAGPPLLPFPSPLRGAHGGRRLNVRPVPSADAERAGMMPFASSWETLFGIGVCRLKIQGLVLAVIGDRAILFSRILCALHEYK